MKEQKNWAYGVSINGVGTIFYSREYFTREGIVNPLTAEPYTKNEINAIEKGDYNPTINLCIAICKALDKTLDELFWE